MSNKLNIQMVVPGWVKKNHATWEWWPVATKNRDLQDFDSPIKESFKTSQTCNDFPFSIDSNFHDHQGFHPWTAHRSPAIRALAPPGGRSSLAGKVPLQRANGAKARGEKLNERLQTQRIMAAKKTRNALENSPSLTYGIFKKVEVGVGYQWILRTADFRNKNSWATTAALSWPGSLDLFLQLALGLANHSAGHVSNHGQLPLPLTATHTDIQNVRWKRLRSIWRLPQVLRTVQARKKTLQNRSFPLGFSGPPEWPKDA